MGQRVRSCAIHVKGQCLRHKRYGGSTAWRLAAEPYSNSAVGIARPDRNARQCTNRGRGAVRQGRNIRAYRFSSRPTKPSSWPSGVLTLLERRWKASTLTQTDAPASESFVTSKLPAHGHGNQPSDASRWGHARKEVASSASRIRYFHIAPRRTCDTAEGNLVSVHRVRQDLEVQVLPAWSCPWSCPSSANTKKIHKRLWMNCVAS